MLPITNTFKVAAVKSPMFSIRFTMAKSYRQINLLEFSTYEGSLFYISMSDYSKYRPECKRRDYYGLSVTLNISVC